MTNLLTKPPVLLAVGWFFIKVALHYAMPDTDTFMVGAVINILAIMGITLYVLPKKYVPGSPVNDLKKILNSTVLYTALVSVFIFCYYQFIDPENIQSRVQFGYDSLVESIEEKGGFEEYKKEFPQIGDQTEEEFLKEQKELTPAFLSPHGQALMSCVALLLQSIFFAILFLAVSRYALRPQSVKRS